MKMIRTAFVIMLAFGFQLVSVSTLATVPKKIRISGRAVDQSNRETFGKIYLSYSEYDWFTKAGAPLLNKNLNKDGSFDFDLPNLNKPYRFILLLRNTSGVTVWRGDYYSEPGDDIKLEIFTNRDSVNFSGRGNEKYNLIYNLVKFHNNENIPKMRLFRSENIKDSVALILQMDSLVTLFRKNQKWMQKMIQSANVDTEMKKIISNEYIYFDLNWKSKSESLIKHNEVYRDKILTKYFLHNDEFSKPMYISNKYCYHYWYFLSSITAFELANKQNSDKVEMKTFYNYLKNNYSGYARERLISTCWFTSGTRFYLSPISEYATDSLMKDALTFFNVPYIKRTLVEDIVYLERTKVGGKIFEADFEGVDGNIFNFKSLIGKVFLIDGWFNGCSGCIGFHKYFEDKVYPKFKENKDFVVLSINVDRKRENWMKGIQSNLYTSSNYVNVTTGSWFDHSFTKYYGLTAAPFLILVDSEGKVCYRADPTTVTANILSVEIEKAIKNRNLLVN